MSIRNGFRMLKPQGFEACDDFSGADFRCGRRKDLASLKVSGEFY